MASSPSISGCCAPWPGNRNATGRPAGAEALGEVDALRFVKRSGGAGESTPGAVELAAQVVERDGYDRQRRGKGHIQRGQERPGQVAERGLGPVVERPDQSIEVLDEPTAIGARQARSSAGQSRTGADGSTGIPV